MSLLQSIILGIVQGITEFLPISSSAHLVLIPYVTGWEYQGLTFDVAVHLGTFLAVIIYFFRDWINIFKNAFGKRKTTDANTPKSFLWMIVLATIPAGIVGFLIQDIVESKLHSPLIISINLIVFGLLLYFFDRWAESEKSLEDFKYGSTFLVGIAQAIALIPGVSRSGITMTAGRGLKFNRADAARFSFLLGTPAILGAAVLELSSLSLAQINTPFIIGIIAATISGFLAIKYLLQYLKRGSFAVFVWYRIILAVIILGIYFL